MRRRAALLPLLLLATCGGGSDADKGEDAFKAVERDISRPLDPREAAPRWEPLAVERGNGSGTRTVTVARGAIQWRARWRCTRGTLELSLTPAPREGNPISRGNCPGLGRAVSVDTGKQAIDIRTEGAWRLFVYQQVTTPLAEPPLTAMRRARVLASGEFQDIERAASGRAVLYRLPDGRLALRFERFRVSANADLFVWVSSERAPRTTRAALRAPHLQVATLKSTLGSQNYVLPRSVDRRGVRSVVIWCEPIRIAYAAATLTR